MTTTRTINVKWRFGEHNRRFTIVATVDDNDWPVNDESTYARLTEQMTRAEPSFDKSAPMWWVDGDGDRVKIDCDSDLQVAIKMSPDTLRVFTAAPTMMFGRYTTTPMKSFMK